MVRDVHQGLGTLPGGRSKYCPEKSRKGGNWMPARQGMTSACILHIIFVSRVAWLYSCEHWQDFMLMTPLPPQRNKHNKWLLLRDQTGTMFIT